MPSARKRRREAAPVAEVEGVRLHLSSRSSSGYKGVFKHGSGRFQVQRRDKDGRQLYLGLFDTVVEAAVAYARAVGRPRAVGSPCAVEQPAAGQPEDPAAHRALVLPPGWSKITDFGKVKGYRGPAGERVASIKEAWRQLEARDRAEEEGSDSDSDSDSDEEGDEAEAEEAAEDHEEGPVRQAEGLCLHLSSSSSTGYKGVCQVSGRFKAQRRAEDGRLLYLGYFDTAVEAAVAYARVGGEAEADEVAEAEVGGEEEGPGTPPGTPPPDEDSSRPRLAVLPLSRAVGAHQPQDPLAEATEALVPVVEAAEDGEAEEQEQSEGEFDLLGCVNSLKRKFPAAKALPIKPAIEWMEREVYGEVDAGGLCKRAIALSREL